MEEFKLELIEIVTHCCDVKTFRFALDEDIHFRPGQYLILTLRLNGKGVSKPFSISNSPTEKGYIEFTKKLTESEFSKSLNKLEIGQSCSIRLPFGKFTPFHPTDVTGLTFGGEFKKCAFLSGGIGITPIRSIFKYATDKKLSSSLILLYSSRTPEYLIFKNDFAIMQKENKNIKVVYTLTHCDEKIAGCRVGFINEEMIKEEVPDYPERKFFICGPVQMVSDMRIMLLDKLSVLEANIFTEDFIGY